MHLLLGKFYWVFKNNSSLVRKKEFQGSNSFLCLCQLGHFAPKISTQDISTTIYLGEKAIAFLELPYSYESMHLLCVNFDQVFKNSSSLVRKKEFQGLEFFS